MLKSELNLIEKCLSNNSTQIIRHDYHSHDVFGTARQRISLPSICNEYVITTPRGECLVVACHKCATPERLPSRIPAQVYHYVLFSPDMSAIRRSRTYNKIEYMPNDIRTALDAAITQNAALYQAGKIQLPQPELKLINACLSYSDAQIINFGTSPERKRFTSGTRARTLPIMATCYDMYTPAQDYFTIFYNKCTTPDMLPAGAASEQYTFLLLEHDTMQPLLVTHHDTDGYIPPDIFEKINMRSNAFGGVCREQRTK